MNNTLQELMEEVEHLVWEISTSDKEKISSIQNILYQWEQMQDSKPSLVDWSGDMVVEKNYEAEHIKEEEGFAMALKERLRSKTHEEEYFAEGFTRG